MNDTADQITALLELAKHGDPEAEGEAWRLLYASLRRRAQRYLRRYAHPTLQPTALVNEAYCQLAAARARGKPLAANDGSHLLALVSTRMLWILRERWRRRRAVARGGGLRAAPLSDAVELRAATQSIYDDCARALERIRRLRPDLAELVKLRVSDGLTIREIAARRGVSQSTVKRDWAFAGAMMLHLSTGERR